MQAPDVQNLNSAFHRINRYPADNMIRETSRVIQWIEIYPVDSAIHLFNNWGQKTMEGKQSQHGLLGI